MAVKINLLDWRTELSNQRKQQFFVMLGLGVAVALGGVGAVYMGVDSAIQYQQQRNRFLQAQIQEMDKKIKEIEELEKVKANLLARMKVIEELQASRAAMVHFFDEILNTLPEGVYIKTLRQNGPNVVVPIASQEYGMREFHIEDLNNYRIAVAEETDDVRERGQQRQRHDQSADAGDD